MITQRPQGMAMQHSSALPRACALLKFLSTSPGSISAAPCTYPNKAGSHPSTSHSLFPLPLVTTGDIHNTGILRTLHRLQYLFVFRSGPRDALQNGEVLVAMKGQEMAHMEPEQPLRQDANQWRAACSDGAFKRAVKGVDLHVHHAPLRTRALLKEGLRR